MTPANTTKTSRKPLRLPYPAVLAGVVWGMFALMLFGVCTARADGWELTLGNDPLSPPVFLVIDKNAQQLFLFRHESPTTLSAGYGCTTGQEPGDKMREGDLKTPEGVYFVRRRRTRGLDFQLYGDEAYTLNYPNPVDRLRGKTGSGIWVHGRGHAITTRETKGCVAMNNTDLAALRTRVDAGTPVLITRGMHWDGGKGESPNAAEARKLQERVLQWARAWEAKSEDFFSFYDPDRYAKAQRASFNGFRNHKKRLFRNLPWLQVMVADLELIPGPGYWVSSFGQFYRSPSLVSEGTKRLYWMKDEDGQYRIVGREWQRGHKGLKQKYLNRLRTDVEPLVEQWRAAWQKGDLDTYLTFYDPRARQADLKGIDAIRTDKNNLWKNNAPKKVAIDDMRIRLHSDGVAIRFTQRYQSSSGYSDRGRKTLVLAPGGGTWKIVREDWNSM